MLTIHRANMVTINSLKLMLPQFLLPSGCLLLLFPCPGLLHFFYFLLKLLSPLFLLCCSLREISETARHPIALWCHKIFPHWYILSHFMWSESHLPVGVGECCRCGRHVDCGGSLVSVSPPTSSPPFSSSPSPHTCT